MGVAGFRSVLLFRASQKAAPAEAGPAFWVFRSELLL